MKSVRPVYNDFACFRKSWSWDSEAKNSYLAPKETRVHQLSRHSLAWGGAVALKTVHQTLNSTVNSCQEGSKKSGTEAIT